MALQIELEIVGLTDEASARKPSSVTGRRFMRPEKESIANELKERLADSE